MRQVPTAPLWLGLLALAVLGGASWAQGAPQVFEPTTTERLALGALVERQRALEADVRSVLADAARARGVRAERLSYDAQRGVLVLAEPAPVSTGARGIVAPGP